MTVSRIIPKKVKILRLFLINLSAAMICLIATILGVIGFIKGINFIVDSSLPSWVFQLGFFIFFSIIVALMMTFSSRSVEIQKEFNKYFDKNNE